jgi:hypothetical protein
MAGKAMKECPKCEIVFSYERFEHHIKTCSFVIGTDLSEITTGGNDSTNPFIEREESLQKRLTMAITRKELE